MENNNRKSVTGEAPRSGYADQFFNDSEPFQMFDSQPLQGGLPRRFTERGRHFDDDIDRFFNDFSNVGGGARSFHDEPAFFRSSLPRRPFPNGQSHTTMPNQNQSSMGRPIPVQRQQTTPQSSPYFERKDPYSVPFHHQRSKSHYDDVSGGLDFQQPTSNNFQPNFRPATDERNFRQFPSSHPNDPNVRIINVQHESPQVKQKPRGHQFVEINNAQPNYESINPDKRRRFTNLQNHDHNYSNARSHSIPNIRIDDYGDGKSASGQQSPYPAGMAIPLPAPAIPLPAPEHMLQKNEEEGKGKSGDEFHSIVEEEKKEAFKEETNGFAGSEVEEPHKNDQMDVEVKPLADSGEHLVQLLDETEQQVEMLREAASRLEQEKETILYRLKNIKLTGRMLNLAIGELEELGLNADRILARCRAVDVCVQTPRNDQQNRALQQVNQMIQSVVDQMRENLERARTKIQGFLNACAPDEIGHIDEKFQSLIIACTADDQKKIRRRILQILEQIEQAQQFSPKNEGQ